VCRHYHHQSPYKTHGNPTLLTVIKSVVFPCEGGTGKNCGGTGKINAVLFQIDLSLFLVPSEYHSISIHIIIHIAMNGIMDTDSRILRKGLSGTISKRSSRGDMPNPFYLKE